MKFKWCRWLFRAVLVLVLLVLAGTVVIVVDGLCDELGMADVAVVLGSKVELNGKPSARLQARLDRTVKLYGEQRFPWIIVSGGRGREGFDEAVVMRDYLVAKGLPPAAILLDSEGINTLATARNTAVIARQRGFKKVLVVSQYFHLPRCRLAMQQCGFDEVYAAHAKFFEWRDVYSSLREAVGYLAYGWRAMQAPKSATGEGRQ